MKKLLNIIDGKYIYVEKVSSNSQLLDLLMNQERDDTILSGDWAKVIPTNWLLPAYHTAREIDGDRIVQLITQNLSDHKGIAND